MIKFLGTIYFNNDFIKLDNDILVCIAVISTSNNLKIKELFCSEFLKKLIDQFDYFNEKKQENALIILTNFALKKEFEYDFTLLHFNGLINIFLKILGSAERKTEIYDYVIEQFNKIIISYDDLLKKNISFEVENLGAIDVIDKFMNYCKIEELNIKAIRLKNLILSSYKNMDNYY